jgi:undecaprenyl-diphosphatase
VFAPQNRYADAVTLRQAIFIGALQGLTEFLPVSSDGHLVLANILLRISLTGNDALGYDIVLHGGSLLALLLLYRQTWTRLLHSGWRGTNDARRRIGLLLLGTVPGVIAGLLMQDAIGHMRSLHAAGIGFLITGTILMLGEHIGRLRRNTTERMTVPHALLIGIAQAVAILPGVSRSGSTISAGRALGMERRAALDFYFLLAAPIIAGAVGKTLLDAWTGSIVFPPISIAFTGFLASFIVSLLAIRLLQLLVV